MELKTSLIDVRCGDEQPTHSFSHRRNGGSPSEFNRENMPLRPYSLAGATFGTQYISMSRSTFFFCSLAFVFSALFVTMPQFEYAGDPVNTRFETQHFIESGSLSVSADVAQASGKRGQYYFENVRDGSWHSKYGVLNTLIYVPPLLLEKLLIRTVDNWKANVPYRVHVLLLNLFNLLLALFIATYLLLLTERYTEKRWIQFSFLVSVFFTTFCWNYLRAQSTEICQLLFFTGFYYHFIRHWQLRSGHLSYALLFVSALCLTKLLFVLLIPLLLGIAAFKDRTRWRTYFVSMSLLLALLLCVNFYKFGSPFLTGYEQWDSSLGLKGDLFSGMSGFLFDAQRSVFTHFPILFLALLGARKFWVRHRFDAALIGTCALVFFLYLSSIAFWRGEWSYGPRYLLFFLPVLALPSLEIFERLVRPGQRILKTLLAVSVLSVFALSFLLQLRINRFEFFVIYRLREGVFTEFVKASPKIEDYFYGRHFGLISGDILHSQRTGVPLPALKWAEELAGHDAAKELLALTDERIQPKNYFWFSEDVLR